MIVVKYGNVELPIVNKNISYTKASNQVSFSDISCDFTGKTKDELPEKYQELKIYDNVADKVLYFGYLDSFDLGEMREVDVDSTIDISIISPMSLTTLRTVTVIGTYEIKELINNIFTPLIEDGFEIADINVTSRQITVNYLAETIEYCMSDLSNSYNLWWFIDEDKKIYIKEISLIFSGEPALVYDEESMIAGLQYLKPTISSGGYANVVNFKNVRLYQYSRLKIENGVITEENNKLIDGQISSLTNGETLTFNFPVDITKANIVKSAQSNNIGSLEYYGIYCKGKFSNNNTFEFYVKYDYNSDSLVFSDNLDFDGDGVSSNKEFLLIRDSFFSNLITGIKYNGNNTINSIEELKSDSCLIYTVVKIYNDRAISQKKGIISNTGIVEATIDMNEQWKTVQEIQNIGISYIDKNSIELDGTIEAVSDVDVFKVGDIVKISKMFFDSVYVITSVKVSYQDGEYSYTATLNNTNMSESYIDLFRSQPSQQNTDKITQTFITHYYEEEIKEIYEVV